MASRKLALAVATIHYTIHSDREMSAEIKEMLQICYLN